MPGEVNLTCTLNKDAVPPAPSAQLAYVLIDARPTGAVTQVKMPVNLTFVLDHSGSMGGEKLRNVKQAVKLALSQLEPHDLVSVVVFDDKAQALVPPQAPANRAAIEAKVNGIKDDGGTEMAKGMKLGLDEARKNAGGDRVSRILLLTDGQTNGDEARCEQLASEAGQLGIPITALGLGEDWNEQLLDSIAAASSGQADYLDHPDKVVETFAQAVQQMQATVVNNATLVLRLAAGVMARRVWRVIPAIAELPSRAISDRDVQVSLGELDKDNGQSLLVEMMVPVRQPGRYRIAQAEISYDVPSARLTGEKARSDILLTYAADPSQVPPGNTQVMNLIEKVSVFRLQTRALTEAQQGHTQRLRQVATRLLELGESDLAQAAIEEADRVDRGQGMSAGGTKKLQYGTRKLAQPLSDDPS